MFVLTQEQWIRWLRRKVGRLRNEPNKPLVLSILVQKGFGKSEGPSLAKICELLLRGGIHEYEREGSRYLQRLVARPKEKDR